MPATEIELQRMCGAEGDDYVEFVEPIVEHLLGRYPVSGSADLSRAEEKIGRLCNCEPGCCSMFLSHEYMRFRLSILYFNPPKLPLVMQFGDMRLSWDGADLSVMSKRTPEYELRAITSMQMATRKRTREACGLDEQDFY